MYMHLCIYVCMQHGQPPHLYLHNLCVRMHLCIYVYAFMYIFTCIYGYMCACNMDDLQFISIICLYVCIYVYMYMHLINVTFINVIKRDVYKRD